MSSFLYFAYGSNMLSARLTARCPSARMVGLASAEGWQLSFSKMSIDQSGKATIVRTCDVASVTRGVLFEICATELPDLDDHEGKGYHRCDKFEIVSSESQCSIIATTYLARETKEGLIPYDWYFALIVAGGIENGIDPAYLAEIKRTTYCPDQNIQRPARLQAIAALCDAGYPKWSGLLESHLA